MDYNSMKFVIAAETRALEKLLGLLEEQHELLINNDIFKLEEIVKKIELCNKEIAEAEVERRKLSNGRIMSDIVREANNDELEKNHREIKKVIEHTMAQKDINDTLIKMGLGFSVKMLTILNPDRNAKTYTSIGKYK